MATHDDKHSPRPFWPESDVFFGVGVESLLARMNHTDEVSDYFFINLSGYNLNAFLDDFPGCRKRKIIIISSRRLMPLAFFWLTESERVCAVFESCVSLDEISRALNTVPDDSKISFPGVRISQRLTVREVFFLRNYIKTGKTTDFQVRYSMKLTTLKNWKTSLARKLSVKKLEHLLISK